MEPQVDPSHIDCAARIARAQHVAADAIKRAEAAEAHVEVLRAALAARPAAESVAVPPEVLIADGGARVYVGWNEKTPVFFRGESNPDDMARRLRAFFAAHWPRAVSSEEVESVERARSIATAAMRDRRLEQQRADEAESLCVAALRAGLAECTRLRCSDAGWKPRAERAERELEKLTWKLRVSPEVDMAEIERIARVAEREAAARAQGAAEEREACAKLCEQHESYLRSQRDPAAYDARTLSILIRARESARAAAAGAEGQTTKGDDDGEVSKEAGGDRGGAGDGASGDRDAGRGDGGEPRRLDHHGGEGRAVPVQAGHLRGDVRAGGGESAARTPAASGAAEVEPGGVTPPPCAAHACTSTACHHELHARCRQTCKFCGVACACACHGSLWRAPTDTSVRLEADPSVTPEQVREAMKDPPCAACGRPLTKWKKGHDTHADCDQADLGSFCSYCGSTWGHSDGCRNGTGHAPPPASSKVGEDVVEARVAAWVRSTGIEDGTNHYETFVDDLLSLVRSERRRARAEALEEAEVACDESADAYAAFGDSMISEREAALDCKERVRRLRALGGEEG